MVARQEGLLAPGDPPEGDAGDEAELSHGDAGDKLLLGVKDTQPAPDLGRSYHSLFKSRQHCNLSGQPHRWFLFSVLMETLTVNNQAYHLTDSCRAACNSEHRVWSQQRVPSGQLRILL